ncbi:MAG: DNA repair exonuclease [Polyangiales bacterium]
MPRRPLKLVHAADLHVDSPLLGLERYPGAPVERARLATRQAFERVIALCLAEDARFLVLAGDVFDADWKDVNTGLWFIAQLRRLRAIGAEVLLLRGNHDFELGSALPYPDHVHEFSPAGARDGTHTFTFDADGVAFHGVSYATKRVDESLLPRYPRPTPGLLNVGVLHTNAAGSAAGAAHARYAPCTVTELVDHGYDYWALGHVHGHEVLHRAPWVIYPGNTQGRSVRETGPKGCVVVDVDEAGVRDVRFHDTSVMRWFVEEVRLDHDDDRDELLAAVRERLDSIAGSLDGRVGAVRLLVTGACRAHAAIIAGGETIVADLRAETIDRHPDVWLEKIELHTRPATSLDELRGASGLVADLLGHIERLRADDGDADLLRLADALKPLRRKIAAELPDCDPTDRGLLARTLDDAEAWLAERLTGGSDEAER